MPIVYLSPSTHEFIQLSGGGSEEDYMNLIVDAMIPYLRASGIDFQRNDPGLSDFEIIERSNEYPYNLHLALRTQMTPYGYSNPLKGIDVYHYAYSHIGGDRAAAIIADNLKDIYPDPSLVHIIPDIYELELRYTNAPAVVVGLGYRDNEQDVQWLKDNVDIIAANLAQSVATFLNVPFIPPFENIRTPL